MTWLRQRERGAVLGIQFVFWLATLFGRWPARQFVRLLAVFYAAFDRNANRASRAWLERVHSRPATWFDIYHHISMFAQVALDRIFLLEGQHGDVRGQAQWQRAFDQLARSAEARFFSAHI